LLAFARRQVLQPESLKLNDLVADVSKLLRAAIGEQIDFKMVCSPDLQAIYADRTQIEQVLMNLCLNARDAMPQGGHLVVETRNVEIGDEFSDVHFYGSPGKYVLLSVSDSGVGMNKETLDRIFEPFFTTKEPGKGTGLGSATVYGVVKQHEGFVNVYSELGHGTTFRVYLPAAKVVSDVAQAPIPDRVVTGTETVLLAEDHEELREIAEETLTSAGYHVIVANNGEDAVRLFRAHVNEVKVVVLDVIMPRLTGVGAFSQVCAMKPDVPVIFTTGHTEELASLSSGIQSAAGFLQKPYSPKALCQAVRSALSRTNHSSRDFSDPSNSRDST
jgi:two-component system, cell cycle sensor histidine kinase and response regulator CckA